MRCGPRLDDDAVAFSDPVVVVEVLSPSTRARDAGAKIEEDVRVASVRHCLLLGTDRRSAIHHLPGKDGAIATAIVTEGDRRLDPPGITLSLDAAFADAGAASRVPPGSRPRFAAVPPTQEHPARAARTVP